MNDELGVLDETYTALFDAFLSGCLDGCRGDHPRRLRLRAS